MNKIEFAKGAIEIVVSLGVGHVVGDAIKYITPMNVSMSKKILTKIGGMVIGSMVTTAALNYTDERIKRIEKLFKKSEDETEEEF